MKIDIFAHVLLPKFYNKMLQFDSNLEEKYPFIKNRALSDIEFRKQYTLKDVKQVISYVNINPEDYVDATLSAELCKEANEELIETIKANEDIFLAGAAVLPMNNIEEAINIMTYQVKESEQIIAIQLFTRALGKSIADEEYLAIFQKAEELDIPILLHPIFDMRKPDNNIVFSWEYELSQAMLQIVENGILQKYPNLKIIVHHAGAMIPYFAERINHILPKDKADDFKKFYVDTAILGNSKALELAVDYFGIDKVLFGTDAPLGVIPAGATHNIVDAIEQMSLSDNDKKKIYSENFERLFGKVQ